MLTIEREAVAAICLLAALADGVQTEDERLRLTKVLEQLGDVNPQVFQQAMLGRTSVEEQAARINDPATKQLAYELAVGLCNVDAKASPQEQDFLARLARALNIAPQQAQHAAAQAAEVVDLNPASLEKEGPAFASAAAGAAAAGVASGVGSTAIATTPKVDDIGKQVDDSILTYSAINAGLELLPQSIATVAVVPLQTKMVYSIGSKYGYKLDSGHIKEFIATVGLGMTSQLMESYARKFMGGLAGRFLGKTAQKITEKATGPAMTFASTYALGQVAKSYYASGRKLQTSDLRSIFSTKLEEAKGLYASQEGNIRAQAAKLDPAKIINLVRGA
jgi:uncharacterized protein (DUF697 family)/tellurite resistance protein